MLIPAGHRLFKRAKEKQNLDAVALFQDVPQVTHHAAALCDKSSHVICTPKFGKETWEFQTCGDCFALPMHCVFYRLQVEAAEAFRVECDQIGHRFAAFRCISQLLMIR